jgi:PAS domain-containing protein
VRRLVGLALVLAGCGRLGFESATPAADAAHDGLDSAPDGLGPCGLGWCLEPTPVTDDLASVFGVSGTDLWATGGGGTILHRDVTGQWTYADSIGLNMLDLWGASPTDIWVVGDHGGGHWDGTTWSQQTVGNATLNAAWGFAANDIWVVGFSPAFATHWSGTSWTAAPLPAAITDLHAVWGAASNDVWAGGAPGEVAHYDGVSWSAVAVNTIRSISWMHGRAANDIWAAASYGMTLHYDGTAWSEVPTPVTEDFTAIFEVSPTAVWVVGGNGTVLRWDGAAWHVVDIASTQYLSSVWRADGKLFIAGAVGTVLREP